MNQSSESKEFLTFRLSKEIFTLEASRVREVLKYTHITQVPRMPEYLPGVINVRGNVIAVINLNLFFGIKTLEDKKKGWLVIAETAVGDESMQIGMLADSVRDVVRLDAARIGPPPEIGIDIDMEFIRGVGKQNEEFLIIIDIDKVVSAVHTNLCAGSLI
ncbi:chemotaxis protein CheW [Desulfobacterales bacterium HSG16]|nr:chemotaxis protein CheW [Desulfobacterales bacterium HSG16]